MAEWWETPIDENYDLSVPGYSTDGAWLNTPMTDIAAQSGSEWTPYEFDATSSQPWYSGITSALGKVPTSTWGALGAGALGYLADERANRKTTPTTTSTRTDLPPWWEEGAQMGVLSARYLPEYQSILNTPGTMYRNTDIGEYMNPFIEQTLEPTLRNMNIEQAQEAQGIAANAARVGAFGGMRPFLQQELAAERQGRRRDEAIAGAMREGFDAATGLAGQDISTTQADLMKQYESPFKQTGALGEMLAQTKVGGDTTQTQSGGTYNDPLKGALGAGLTALGYLRS